MYCRLLFSVFFCIAFCAATPLAGQCYTTFRQDGIDFYNKGKWADAKTQFKEAVDCKSDKPANNDLTAWIAKCDKEIAKAKGRERPRPEKGEDDILIQIEAAATRAADDSFWEALKDGDIADCEKYLNNYPSGRHSFEANQRKKLLTQSESQTKGPEDFMTYNRHTAFRDCSECPLMMPVEGGDFIMGDSTVSRDACPHQETLTSFSIGVYEVTVEEYIRFVDATSSHYPHWLVAGNPYNVETGSEHYYKRLGYSRNAKTLPICGVSRDNAVAYCKWLSRKTGKKYRLPLEKEWEYAAKGGQKTRNCQYAGSNNIKTEAWTGNKPHPVGEKAANELGLYDMSGNLWEWCQDQWAAYPGCTASECIDCFVLRGGSWESGDCSTANRDATNDTINHHFGFRLARDGQ